MGVLQQTARPTQSVAAPGRLVAAGIVLGLAWGASLRAWMTLLAIGFGDAPGYSWNGTFGGVILPAGIIGGVLGWTEYARRTGGRRYWRYTALAPLLFIVINLLYVPDFFGILFSTGGGGGAVAVVVVGLGGGFAFSGRGHSGPGLLPVFRPSVWWDCSLSASPLTSRPCHPRKPCQDSWGSLSRCSWSCGSPHARYPIRK